MTDPHEHDESFRHRIREAVRHLNGVSTGLQSDEDIAAQLDAVGAAPLAEDEVQRIMNKVNRGIGLPATQEGNAMQKRRSETAYVRPETRPRGSSSVAVLVTASVCLMAAVGLLQLAQQEEEPRVAEAEPVSSVERLTAGASELRPRLTAFGRHIALPATGIKVGDTLSTGERERRRVRLPDGSVLFVNEQTSLTVQSQRRLKLVRGEVFVEVIPAELAGGDRFVVTTPDRAVTALGTKFAVSAGMKETSVLVTQGKVEVTGVGPVVKAGQVVRLDDRVQPSSPDGDIEVAPRASEALNWTRELIAASTPVMVPKSDHAGGSIVVVDPDGQEMRLSLRRYDVDVHIQDGFARTTIDQTYFNHTFSRQEGTFHFPLPPDASLSRLAMYVNGKLMEGGMAERQRARDVYEQIRHTRRDPALLEWVDGSTFKMRVFPLEARREKRIVLSYTQRLPNDYDRTVYRFPAGHSMETVDDWTARVRVHNGADEDSKVQWFSPSHLLKATDEGDDLILEGELTNAALDKDLVVELRPAGRKEQRPAVRFSSMQHEGYQYLMLRYRPDLAGELERPKRNWVFLFESSGDRNPLLARVQIEVIRTLLDNAEHDDTFSIVTAATSGTAFRSKPVKCSGKNIERAVKHLEDTHLVGALDLGKAFATCDDFCEADGESLLVHVGSATPTVGERDAKKLLKRLPDDATYIGVGVGNRWDRAFMKSAVSQTGGHFTQINPDEKVAWRAFELFSTLNAPRLLQIDVKSERNNPRWLCFAETIAHGQEIAAVTRVAMTAKLPESVTVSGVLDGEQFEHAIDVDDIEDQAGYLPRIWARQEIDRLVAAGAEKHKAEIIVLSKAMYVMSPFTSLLVLEDESMYKQFAIDRGRKDHWALYPAPDQIEVRYEPDTVLVKRDTPIEVLTRQLKELMAERDVAKANFDLSIRDTSPADQIAQNRSRFEQRDEAVRILEQKVARVEALTENQVVKTATSVLGRGRSTGPAHEVVPLTFTGPLPMHWGFVPAGQVDRFVRSDFDFIQPPVIELSGIDTFWELRAGPAKVFVNGGMPSLNGQFFGEDENGNGIVPLFGRGGVTWSEDGRVRGFSNGDFEWMDDAIVLWDTEKSHRHWRRDRLSSLMLLGDGIDSTIDHRIREYELAFRMHEPVSRLRGLANMDFGVEVEGRQQMLALRELNRRYQNGRGLTLDGFSLTKGLGVLNNSQRRLLGIAGADQQLIRSTSESLREVQELRELETVIDAPVEISEIELRLVELGTSVEFESLTRSDVRFVREQLIDDRLLSRSYDVSDLILPVVPLGFDSELRVGSRLIDIDGDGLVRSDVTQPTLQYIPRSNGSYVSVVVAPAGIVGDPVSYAPGMESSTADLFAVLEREAPEALSRKTGKVDRGARRLIERARRHGWEEVSIPGGESGQKLIVLVNGAGEYVFERPLHEGLTERVVCDGESLWHLYPDLAIGAQRAVSRFHRRSLQRLIPWAVAPVDDLAIGANVELVNRRTVRIVPLRDKDDDSKRRRLAIELQFDNEARLIERRVIDLDDNDALLSRVAFEADGTVTLFAGDSQQSRSITLSRRPADGPTLKPETDNLAVLPLPYRSAESYAVAVPSENNDGSSDYSKVSEADAMKLIATYFANRDAASMWQVIRSRFIANGDARIGFATLLASADPKDAAPIREIASKNGVEYGLDIPIAPTEFPATLAFYLVQWSDWHRERDLTREFVAPKGTFLPTLARAHNQYARWKTGSATQDRTPAQIRTEFRRAMAFIRELKTPALAWRLLTAIDQRFEVNTNTDAAYYELLAKEAGRLEKSAALAGTARLTRIQWLLTAGHKDRAEELYAEFLNQAADFGIAPRLHSTLHDSFVEQFSDNGVWRKLVSQAGRKLASKDRPAELIALAVQCLRNSEHDLGRSLFETAIADVDLVSEPAVAFVGLQYAWQAEDWAEAEKCLQALLQDDERVRIASLWRRASELAASLGNEDESLRRMEQALELEFADLPDMIDIAKFREAYVSLLARMEEFAQERVIGEEALPEDFIARVIRVTDRWRSVDPDVTASCQAAARILDIAGEHSLAWNYWTTPLAVTPNESSAWTALARALRDRSRIVEANMAFAEAFACEQTNPEILIEQADMLLLDGQRKKAMGLYEQISDGKWQPRFSGIQSRAAAALNAREERTSSDK